MIKTEEYLDRELISNTISKICNIINNLYDCYIEEGSVKKRENIFKELTEYLNTLPIKDIDKKEIINCLNKIGSYEILNEELIENTNKMISMLLVLLKTSGELDKKIQLDFNKQINIIIKSNSLDIPIID